MEEIEKPLDELSDMERITIIREIAVDLSNAIAVLGYEGVLQNIAIDKVSDAVKSATESICFDKPKEPEQKQG